jgi:hypothetical protein
VRRKFLDVHAATGSAIAKEALERIGQLYAIEKTINRSPPDQRRQQRLLQQGASSRREAGRSRIGRALCAGRLARSRAEPSLLRGSRHLAVRRSDGLGCTDPPSPGYRRRHGLDPGFGGVSVFALQFARVLGARVIATTSTADKAKRLKALGASDVINYIETPDWDEKARELTDGRGVDCVVEIGGPWTIAKSLKALAVGGHVSLIGASLSPSGRMLDPLLLSGRGITVGAISVGSRADFEAMNQAIVLHRLRLVIDRTFPFGEAQAAYRHFEGRGHFGKVVITHG